MSKKIEPEDEWHAQIRELLSQVHEDDYPELLKGIKNITADVRRGSIKLDVDNVPAGKEGKP